MTDRPIMDAGPAINFFSLHQERLLFGTLGALAVPEAVQEEIRRKAERDQRFAAAKRVLDKVPSKLLEILSDDASDQLIIAVERVSNARYRERLKVSKDLGETMVIAHASVAAEAGQNVFVLIDDGGGRKMAAAENARLERLRAVGHPVGRISLVSTITVLQKAAGRDYIPDRGSMRKLYDRLRNLDDGLPPIDSTNLLKLQCWSLGQ